MKKSVCYLLFSFSLLIASRETAAQALPMHRYSVNKQFPIDIITQKPSFAFSSRKLRNNYSGYALRVRRSADNAQADISFDANNVVSDNSVVKIAVVGTSGFALNATTTLASFRSANTLYVTIWYDQSINGYNGVQTVTSRQPVYSMGVVGSTNQYPSLVFTGTQKHNVTVNQTLLVLLGNGLKGSVMLVAKILASVSTNNSFGYSDTPTSKRWAAHMNWPADNNMYTDLGSIADLNRSFLNDATVGFNLTKQYSIIRNTNSKIVRVSGIDRGSSNLNVTSQSWSAGSTFGIGITTGSLDASGENGFTGNIPEFILFPEPLSAIQYQVLEYSQMNFWGAF
ncbi:hypothetical protein V7S76_08215 [Aquirufa sp. ROCK2-A2]